MSNKIKYNLLLFTAVAALFLVLFNIGLFYANQNLSVIVEGRQQYLQQTNQLRQQLLYSDDQ